MVFLVLFDPFRPKNGAKNQFWAKQKILPLEIPTMMPETPIKMGELTLGTLTAGMTIWHGRTTDGRTDAAMIEIPLSEISPRGKNIQKSLKTLCNFLNFHGSVQKITINVQIFPKNLQKSPKLSENLQRSPKLSKYLNGNSESCREF